MGNSASREITFSHTVMEGTPYEVGRRQGEMLADDRRRAGFLTPPPPFLDKYSAGEAKRALRYIDRYCAGLEQEILGAADAFGVSPEEIAFLGGRNKETGASAIPVDPNGRSDGGGCSHFAVLPSATEDGRLYAGRNQDDGPENSDLRLCTTRVRGKAAHIGFSDMIFGRVDGMNAYGLCVTSSLGAPGVWLRGEGLPYFAVVRTLLDRCGTVDDALTLLESLPVAWCTNLIVAGRKGEAALVEIAYRHRSVRRIGPGSPERFVCAANHYTLPEMKPHDAARRKESVRRYKAAVSRLGQAVPRVGKNGIREILSDPAPRGLCLRHYSSGLGTLWSVVFDAADAVAEICFGSPCCGKNPWRTFDLRGPVGETAYRALLSDEAAPPGFWERLPPGTDD